jgi:signal transduction histidine kinase
MSGRTARWVAWTVGLISIVLMAGTLVLMFVHRASRVPDVSDSWAISSLLAWAVHLGVPVLGIVIASRRPDNSLGWLFLVAGMALGIVGFSRAYAIQALLIEPGSLPAGRALAWLSNWLWPIPNCLLLFLFLLFPTGHLRSRRWRPVAWLDGGVFILIMATTFSVATINWSHPFRNENAGSGALHTAVVVVFFVAAFALLLGMVLSFASLVFRFAGSTGDERLQLKWFVTAAGLVAAAFVVGFFSNTVGAQVVASLSLLALWVAIGVAIMHYRLYDIDIIISRAIVYGALAVFITAVYVIAVVILGALIGTTELLALVATAVVAVAFQPLRQRVQKVANRLVYGERATPYEVLSKFSDHLAETYSADDVLPRMAQVLADGTGASRAEVWLRVGPELRPVASWPAGGAEASPVPIRGESFPKLTPASKFEGKSTTAPVRHQGKILGAVVVTKPPYESLTPAEEKLVTDLASQAGLVLRNVALIEDLRGSRQRLVAAQDEERRRLERNLHDGAQQQLVSLSVKLGLLGKIVMHEPDRAAPMAEQLQTEALLALEELRDLARGIYPPLLADQGLAAALEAQAKKAPVPVTITAESNGRFPQDVEAAVYFCFLEALQNVTKYANASKVDVRLFGDRDHLRLEVEDDGVGFDTAATTYGTGLQGMADRLDAIGGSLNIRSEPGRGTMVSGSIPATPR